MADDWFKLDMSIFSNRKMKYLRRLPNGDSIALFWIALLAEARRCNSDGKIFLTESIPYTPALMADEFDFGMDTVKSALDVFEQLDMICNNDGFIAIAGWEDHQNAEGLAKIREQNRVRKQRQRENQKMLSETSLNVSRDSHVTVTQCHATEEDKEKDIDVDIEKEKERIDFQSIVDLYHDICKSFPSVRSLSDSRKKAIKARLNTYTLDDFKTVFENAEASSFLKGKNDRNWQATFDWIIKDTNMAKVLEGNYKDKPSRYGRKEPVPGWMGSRESDDDEIAAVRRMMADDNSATVGNNPELADRAEKLKQMLQR